MSLERSHVLAGRDPLNDLRVRTALPTGTVTFVFSDVAGSTSLLRELGAEAHAAALADTAG